jgi:uncharacterized protein (DUF58 family)
VKLRPTRSLLLLLALGGAGVIAGFAMARPEPIVLAAPLLIAAALGIGWVRAADIQVRWRVGRDRCTEGDTIVVSIDLDPGSSLSAVEVSLDVPPGLEAGPGTRTQATTLHAGERRTLEVELECPRWGTYRIEDLRVRVWGPLGMLAAQGHLPVGTVVTVYPLLQTLRRLARPLEPIAAAGTQVARVLDDGTEFAQVRPFAPGDRARDVNWRATARRGSLWVNAHHPERSADVVVFVDTYSATSLDWSVRVAASLVRAYLATRDRVGIVNLGGIVRWLRPGAGRRHEVVLIAHLLESASYPGVGDTDLDLIPTRVLPSKALVVGVSALEDQRYITALIDLASRGLDIVVIEIAADTLTAPSPGQIGATAFRLWLLQRAATRARLRELGIPVVVWDHREPLAPVVEEVAAWPRFARRAG